jgi:signal transduction histidine kinase/CheY-like chemotaxis protein
MFGSLRRWYALAAIVALGAAAASIFIWASQRHSAPMLRAGTRNNSLSSVNAAGRIDVLAVDVLTEAARRLGISLQWVNCPEGPDQALRTNKVDLWPLMMSLPQRKRQFHITEPWLASERCLVTKGEPPKRWNGVRVAYGLGLESQLQEIVPGAHLMHVQGDIEAVGAICNGEAAAAYVMRQALSAFILRKPQGCESTELRVTPVAEGPLKLGIASRFEATRQADMLRLEIGRMATEGLLDKIFNKYSLGSVAETANIYELLDANHRANVFKGSAVAFAVAFTILLWQVRRVRQARRTAEKATSAKSEFLANMSHEIRTPLNGIVAMTELLSRSGLNSEQSEMAGIVLSSSESLMTIVNDILDFSKIEAGSLQVEEIPFDLRALAYDAVRLFAPQAKEKSLAIECSVAADIPPMILGDPVRVRQVLTNLTSNAIKFTAEGSVKVEVELAGDSQVGPAVLIRVTDSGIGIAPEVSARLFRAFSQADSATTRKYGGTGLGLAIVLRLVTLMGGSVSMESAPGKGSTFWFLIPARAAAVVDEVAKQPPAASLILAASCGPDVVLAPEVEKTRQAGQPACRILIVEDNPVNQMVASRALGTLGYEAEVAAGGEAALQALERSQFDLILMDCQMPGMDGYDATAEIRRREGGRSRIPIVAMTANAVDGDRERCMAAGMDAYISKPIRLALLGTVLESWLAGKVAPAA